MDPTDYRLQRRKRNGCTASAGALHAEGLKGVTAQCEWPASTDGRLDGSPTDNFDFLAFRPLKSTPQSYLALWERV